MSHKTHTHTFLRYRHPLFFFLLILLPSPLCTYCLSSRHVITVRVPYLLPCPFAQLFTVESHNIESIQVRNEKEIFLCAVVGPSIVRHCVEIFLWLFRRGGDCSAGGGDDVVVSGAVAIAVADDVDVAVDNKDGVVPRVVVVVAVAVAVDERLTVAVAVAVDDRLTWLLLLRRKKRRRRMRWSFFFLMWDLDDVAVVDKKGGTMTSNRGSVPQQQQVCCCSIEYVCCCCGCCCCCRTNVSYVSSCHHPSTLLLLVVSE